MDELTEEYLDIEKLERVNIEDPLFLFFSRKLRLDIKRLMIILLLVNIVRSIIFPYIKHSMAGNSLFLNPGPKDIQAWIAGFIVQPLLLIVYWKTIQVIPEVYRSLFLNGVILERKEKNAKKFSSFLEDLEMKMTSKYTNIIVFSGAAIILLIFHIVVWPFTFRNNPVGLSGIGAYPYYWWDQLFIESFHGYTIYCFVLWSAWRCLAFAQSTFELWKKFDIDVKVYHSDGAGGLRAIGEFTRYIGLLIGALVMFAFASVYGNPERKEVIQILYTMLIAIIVIGPAAFFGPVWATHKAMLKWRERKIDSLNEKITDQWKILHKDDTLVKEDKVQNLSSLIELTKLDKKIIPTWPFGSFTIVRYISRLSLPVIALVAPWTVELLLSMLVNLLLPTGSQIPNP